MALDRRQRSQAPLRTPSAPGDGPVYRRLAVGVGWVLRLTCDEVWDDARQLPADGGVLVVGNHLAYVDALSVGRYLVWSGRWVRYLGKAEVWNIPGIGWLARKCHQIPVHRGTDRAKDALGPARIALEEGRCIGIFPEGGRTRDPDFWPMVPRTGAARLALATGVPVIPVGHWGAQEFMPGRRLAPPRLWPRKTLAIVMGDPVPLDDLRARADDPDAVREASVRIMDAVTTLVEGLRGEKRPDGVWDTRLGRRA